MNRIMKRVALPIGAAVVLGTTGFAFMASNAVPQTFAGAGEGQISGYTVSNITYNTFAAYGGDAYVKSVTFTLDQPAKASNVGAYIDANDGTTSHRYTNCTNNGGTATSATTFTCLPTANPENLTVGHAKMLHVYSAQ